MRPRLNGGTLSQTAHLVFRDPEEARELRNGPFSVRLSVMAQPVPNPPPGFDALSVEEKIEYVESLWDRIVAQTEPPVPDWHRELLQERLDAYRSDPTEGRPWTEVRAELQRKFGSAR
jgi:putative addiction module component (TIGR02574 family)